MHGHLAQFVDGADQLHFGGPVGVDQIQERESTEREEYADPQGVFRTHACLAFRVSTERIRSAAVDRPIQEVPIGGDNERLHSSERDLGSRFDDRPFSGGRGPEAVQPDLVHGFGLVAAAVISPDRNHLR